MAASHYSVLGVTETATAEDIQKAYRTLSLKYHPDKCTDEDTTEATEKFQRIVEAYKVLNNPAKRKEYDDRRVFKEVGEDDSCSDDDEYIYESHSEASNRIFQRFFDFLFPNGRPSHGLPPEYYFTEHNFEMFLNYQRAEEEEDERNMEWERDRARRAKAARPEEWELRFKQEEEMRRQMREEARKRIQEEVARQRERELARAKRREKRYHKQEVQRQRAQEEEEKARREEEAQAARERAERKAARAREEAARKEQEEEKKAEEDAIRLAREKAAEEERKAEVQRKLKEKREQKHEAKKRAKLLAENPRLREEEKAAEAAARAERERVEAEAAAKAAEKEEREKAAERARNEERKAAEARREAERAERAKQASANLDYKPAKKEKEKDVVNQERLPLFVPKPPAIKPKAPPPKAKAAPEPAPPPAPPPPEPEPARTQYNYDLNSALDRLAKRGFLKENAGAAPKVLPRPPPTPDDTSEPPDAARPPTTFGAALHAAGARVPPPSPLPKTVAPPTPDEPDIIRATDHHAYRTLPCKYFRSPRGCRHGDACTFLHSPAAASAPPAAHASAPTQPSVQAVSKARRLEDGICKILEKNGRLQLQALGVKIRAAKLIAPKPLQAYLQARPHLFALSDAHTEWAAAELVPGALPQEAQEDAEEEEEWSGEPPCIPPAQDEEWEDDCAFEETDQANVANGYPVDKHPPIDARSGGAYLPPGVRASPAPYTPLHTTTTTAMPPVPTIRSLPLSVPRPPAPAPYAPHFLVNSSPDAEDSVNTETILQLLANKGPPAPAPAPTSAPAPALPVPNFPLTGPTPLPTQPYPSSLPYLGPLPSLPLAAIANGLTPAQLMQMGGFAWAGQLAGGLAPGAGGIGSAMGTQSPLSNPSLGAPGTAPLGFPPVAYPAGFPYAPGAVPPFAGAMGAMPPSLAPSLPPTAKSGPSGFGAHPFATPVADARGLAPSPASAGFPPSSHPVARAPSLPQSASLAQPSFYPHAPAADASRTPDHFDQSSRSDVDATAPMPPAYPAIRPAPKLRPEAAALAASGRAPTAPRAVAAKGTVNKSPPATAAPAADSAKAPPQGKKAKKGGRPTTAAPPLVPAAPPWSCAECTLENPDSVNKCGVCGADRQMQPIAGVWACELCTYENSRHSVACGMCGFRINV